MTKKKKPLTPAAKARRQQQRRDPFGRACIAVADYLESEGWSVLLFGGPRVQQQPGALKSNFEFVLRFTGGRKAAPKPDAAVTGKEKS